MIDARRASFLLAIATAGALLWASQADAEVRIYRYSLDTLSGDAQFAGEIPGGVRPAGQIFEVETDAQGRLSRYARIRDGKKLSEVRYVFEGTAQRPSGAETFTAGEPTGRLKIERDAQGNRTRINYYTIQGALTSYTMVSRTGNKADWKSFTPAGKQKSRSVEWYSPRGLETRDIAYYEDGSYGDRQIDENTGLAQSRKQYSDKGQLDSSNAYTYDGNGDLTRDDIYDSDNVWYGATEYAQGLTVREFYKFKDGSSQETRTTYDEKRWAREAKFSINGVLICTFTFDRQPNGVVKRTLALGPNGDLWAEYPDHYVDNINRDGHPIDGVASTIYKSGNWW